MNVAILGFGREGRSILKFLRKSRLFEKAEIKILDKKFRKNYLTNLKRFDFIFRSPGVPWNLPTLRRARDHGVKFSSATRLFFEEAAKMARRGGPHVIGVTGTKGKGTTSTILYSILKAARKNVFLAGNIGKSALDILPKINARSLVILELSSFQLQDLEKSPSIAVVLDVFPDHQDNHRSLKEYYGAKTNIARHQTRIDKIFFFKNNRLSRWVASKGRGRKIAVDEKRFKLFQPEDLRLRGAHNFKNAVMASTVARNLGVPEKTIIRIARSFRGLEHRLEFVRAVHGVEFYNDSASTNPHTAAAAVHAFRDESHIVIAGGQDKRLDYRPLAEALRTSPTHYVILFGENKRKIGKAIKTSGVPLMFAATLKEAVRAAYRLAKNSAIENTRSAIIFSPGAASFDMFKNYADRGVAFKAIVKSLKMR